jgi:hypothetical protein
LRFLRRKKNAAATGSRKRLPGDARESRTPASLPSRTAGCLCGRTGPAGDTAAHSPVSKRPFDLQRSAATCEGWGGTLPPRCTPAHARASSGPRVHRMAPTRAMHATAVRQYHSPPGTHRALARGQTAGAVRLVRAARLSLDAGALRQYIANPCKEGGKIAEGQMQAERPRSPSQADAHVERKPKAVRQSRPRNR